MANLIADSGFFNFCYPKEDTIWIFVHLGSWQQTSAYLLAEAGLQVFSGTFLKVSSHYSPGKNVVFFFLTRVSYIVHNIFIALNPSP